jgi:hypothetical protein
LITYRFYIFDTNGDTARRITRVLPDDNAALTEAKKIICDGAVEIWRSAGKGHKVARLDATEGSPKPLA